MVLFCGWLFLAGLAIGSFLNVCIYRIPLGQSIVFPSSRCMTCHHALVWYDNIPLISYLFLVGRCRYCRTGISVQYPLIEFMVGCLFAGSVMWFTDSPVLIVIGAIFPTILLAVSIIDFRYQVIPDEFSGALLVLGLGLSGFNPVLGENWMIRLLNALTGIGIAAGLLGLVYVMSHLRNRELMGGGDIKLLAGIGVFLGWRGALIALFLGALFSIMLIVPVLIKNLKNYTRPMPFGPCLAVGAVLYLYFHDKFLLLMP